MFGTDERSVEKMIIPPDGLKSDNAFHFMFGTVAFHCYEPIETFMDLKKAETVYLVSRIGGFPFSIVKDVLSEKKKKSLKKEPI